MPIPTTEDLLMTLQQGAATPEEQRQLHAYVLQMRLHLSAFQKVYRLLYDALANLRSGDALLGLSGPETSRTRPPYGEDWPTFPKLG